MKIRKPKPNPMNDPFDITSFVLVFEAVYFYATGKTLEKLGLILEKLRSGIVTPQKHA